MKNNPHNQRKHKGTIVPVQDVFYSGAGTFIRVVFFLLYTISCSFVVITFTGCSLNDSSLAGGSEAGNAKISGVAMINDSTPCANALVQLRTSTFLANSRYDSISDTSLQLDATTDPNGNFYFDSVPAGNYRIYIESQNHLGTVIDCEIERTTSELSLGEKNVQALGELEGIIDGAGVKGNSLCIRIYGLEKRTYTDSVTGKFNLTNVPAGVHNCNIRSSLRVHKEKQIQNISIDPGTSKNIGTVKIAVDQNEDFSQWKYSKSIVLNTTENGAHIESNLYGFPILIRLDSSFFDFSEASDNGSDIRFAKIDNESLPHEIELWDANNGKAAVWVRIDTILGQNIQQLSMYWGDPDAINVSSGSDVFRTENGFAGVWHLSPSGDPDFYPDASINRNDGRRIHNNDTVRQSEGVIGGSLDFHRNWYTRIRVPDNPTLRVQSFTFSAWFKRFPANSAMFPVIVSKQNWNDGKGYIFGFVHRDSTSMVTRLLSGNTSNNYSTFYTDTVYEQWVHVAGAYDGSWLRMYRNGELVADTLLGPVPISYDTSEVSFGRAFKGTLDEIRICRQSRNPEWVKLLYENQRPDQKFVSYQ